MPLSCDFTVYNWNGVPQPVLDREDRVLLVLGGFPPNATDWKEAVTDDAAREMENAATKIYTEPKWRCKAEATAAKTPCRGPHAAESVGASMGSGQPFPMMLQHSVVNTTIFAGLFGLKCFERIAGWTNTGFAPLLHEYYRQTLDDLFTWDAGQDREKHLRCNFLRRFSVFAAATFNFGPHTVTFPHIDFGNLAWGWCAITALGWFNPDLGGHLILWDLKLIIHFPPGSTILLPSAILRHLNVKIQPGESRYSFTQFTPAGLFHWVYNRFRTDRDINTAPNTSPEEHERHWADRMQRWQEGVKMYHVWDKAPNAVRA
ncbi:hypothetical protein MVEN_01723100 [Mycena venus]|uniref:Uncharacterized protein n=1 Tax=Mycena venus TaxID=2733690 RepID=A0A8H6XJV8_9AGAR|nr:hypothetical protein MVEN_01723100 [Mycena venus]